MIFLIVSLIWAAALLPPLLRARLDGNPVDSVGKFRRHLRVLESTSPAAKDLANGAGLGLSMPAAWAHEARRLRLRRRRHQVVRSLLALMGTTLVVGLVPGLHLLLVLHVALDVAFLLYARSLVRIRTQRVHAPAAASADEVEPVALTPRAVRSSAL